MICSKIKPDIIVLSEVWPAEAASDIAKKCTEKGFPLEAIVPAQKPTVVQLVAFLKKPGTVELIIREPLYPEGKTAIELTKIAEEWIESHIKKPA